MFALFAVDLLPQKINLQIGVIVRDYMLPVGMGSVPRKFDP